MVQKLVLPLRPQMVNVSFSFNDVELLDFDQKKTTSWLISAVEELGFDDASLGFVFVSDEYLLEINKQYLNHDYYTDIITFNYNEENSLSGEMYISVDRVADNAVEFGDGVFVNELNRVLIHGVLHLAGFDDQNETMQAEIRSKENYYLSKLNVSRET